MTPMVPTCCMAKRFMKWYMYKYFGHYHNDGDNQCENCGNPAYKRWDKTYSGYVGFCTYCDTNWRES